MNGNMFESSPQREIMMCQGLIASNTAPIRAVRRSTDSRSREKKTGMATTPATRKAIRAAVMLSPKAARNGISR